MYWQNDQDDDTPYQVPEDIVDLSFRVSCRALPLDHAHSLGQAIFEALPWFAEEPAAGLHLIHGAESGNGWLRPEDPNALLQLSRRTRMSLRLPTERVDAATTLVGQTLDIGGHSLTLGETSVRKLSTITTVFARYVVTDGMDAEEDFLAHSAQLLENLGIRVKKMMAGRLHKFSFPDGTLGARSLMIDGLSVEESVRLQQRGLGPRRKYGCGLFLPHKGIDAVVPAK